jgi:hypothetical protein
MCSWAFVGFVDIVRASCLGPVISITGGEYWVQLLLHPSVFLVCADGVVHTEPHPIPSCNFSFFLVGPGFELRALLLQSRHSTA